VANTAQAKKRARQGEKHRRHNMGLRSAVRTSMKKVILAIEAGKGKDAEAAYQAAVPMIDRMAGKGILHKNKAARHKSRLLASIRKLAA
jgi:small subunit ribosomal protein S20